MRFEYKDYRTVYHFTLTDFCHPSSSSCFLAKSFNWLSKAMAINMSMCLFVSSFCCGKTCHCKPLLKMLIGEDMNWPRKTMCVSFKPTLPRKWHQPNNVWGFQILSLISSIKTYFYGEQLDNIKKNPCPTIFFQVVTWNTHVLGLPY